MITIAPKTYLIIALVFSSFSLKAITINTATVDSLIAINETDLGKKFEKYAIISYHYYRAKTPVLKSYLDSAKRYREYVNDTSYTISLYYSSWASYYYYQRNYDSALIMYNQGLKTARNASDKYISDVIVGIGFVYSRKNELDSAIYYLHRAKGVYDAADTSCLVENGIAHVNNIIGSIYLKANSYDSAVTYFYKALKTYDENSEKSMSATVLMNIGNIYLMHKEYDKALLDYINALNVLKQCDLSATIFYAKIYANMGLCYRALELYDTSLVYYNKALIIRKRYGPPRSLAGLYDNMGNLYKAQEEFDQALMYYQKALKIRNGINSPRWQAMSNGNIGLMYYEMHEYKKAIKYLLPAAEISDKYKFMEISAECKIGLSKSYEYLGDYKKALKYNVEYRNIQDSIHSTKLEEKLNSYKQKYELSKRDRQIEKLEEDRKLEAAQVEKQGLLVEKQSAILKGLSAVAVLLIFILFIIQRHFKMKRKTDQELFAKNEQLNRQKTLELMKELEVGSISAFVEGQEKERMRIASDLHDRLGVILSTVKLHFNSLDSVIEGNAEAEESYNFAIQLLDNSVEEVRAVSRNLTKGVLVQFGLIAAVENMCDAINAAGKMKMEVISSGIHTRLDSEVEIVIFRIVQELITNVIRHSQSNEVFVQFSGADSSLNIMVEDQGIGFDVSKIKSEGMGIENLKNRIHLLDGELSIDSVIGQGTTVIIDIPFEKGNKIS